MTPSPAPSSQMNMPPAPAAPAALRDPARLAAIDALDLLSPRLADTLHDAIERTAARLGLPIALVSVVLPDAQHFAAAHGLPEWVADVGGTPIEWSFCRHAVESGTPFIVEDARGDARIGENPLVDLEDVRSYAGVPLVTPHGHTVGAVCVIGTVPRTFSDADVATLRACADVVMAAVQAAQRTQAGASPQG